MGKLKAVGFVAFLASAGLAVWYVGPGANAGGIKNPFTCARDPKCVALYPVMKKQVEETPPELKNPFAECELANPFRDDTQCAQVRAARAQAAARTVR